jgi:endonuclease/exonuclease/phosphatase family metal-dependent hydrolase
VPELTVASFNIHWGRSSVVHGLIPFDVPAACATLDADVLVVQESWAPDGGESSHDAIAASLGMAVVSESLARSTLDPRPRVIGPPGDRAVGEGEWCIAVLSRLPITATRMVPLPRLRLDKVNRTLVHVEVDVDGSPLTVVGTHFTHLEFGGPLHTGALRRGLPPADRPAVFLGDMNMWGWCLSAMVPPGWQRIGKGKTWPAHRPHSRIDHIALAGGVQEMWSEVAPELGSDHRAVRARLRVP